MKEKLYSIGEVARMFHLPVSTLRYYDRQNLIPDLERTHGIRQFSDRNLESLRVIECLKTSGLEIREIARFMDLCRQGNESLEERRQMFVQRRQVLQAEIDRLQAQMHMIEFKCWYYDTAVQLQDEARVQVMIPEGLPDPVRRIYEASHPSEPMAAEDFRNED